MCIFRFDRNNQLSETVVLPLTHCLRVARIFRSLLYREMHPVFSTFNRLSCCISVQSIVGKTAVMC